ncbi:hypothetical protein LXL04_037737 [Taraxacum kok-saghyz]
MSNGLNEKWAYTGSRSSASSLSFFHSELSSSRLPIFCDLLPFFTSFANPPDLLPIFTVVVPVFCLFTFILSQRIVVLPAPDLLRSSAVLHHLRVRLVSAPVVDSSPPRRSLPPRRSSHQIESRLHQIRAL